MRLFKLQYTVVTVYNTGFNIYKLYVLPTECLLLQHYVLLVTALKSIPYSSTALTDYLLTGTLELLRQKKNDILIYDSEENKLPPFSGHLIISL